MGLRASHAVARQLIAPTTDRAGLHATFHFHDLGHTWNTVAAASGASTRELMNRMGQAGMRAALIYQHATSERDQEIARNMDQRIRKARKVAKIRPKKPDDGATGALARIA